MRTVLAPLTKGIADFGWTRWEIASAEVVAGSEDADVVEVEVVAVGGMTMAEGGLEILAGVVEVAVVAVVVVVYVHVTRSFFLALIRP